MTTIQYVRISMNVQVQIFNHLLSLNVILVSEKSHVCDHHADCIDLDGKYDCKCHIGYAGNGFECINIDECLTATFLCPSNSGKNRQISVNAASSG